MLRDDQIIVNRGPIPEPLRFLEPRETETRKMHGLEEYGLMHGKLYEDISQRRAISTAYAYPAKVSGRYVMDPPPIPKFDIPKLEMDAIQLFGAGREQCIYALPPHSKVVSLDFEDYPFVATKADHPCDLCGSGDSYLKEVIMDDAGNRMFVCSDTGYCRSRREAGHVGWLAAMLLLAAGCDRQVALGKVSGALKRLNIPERLRILSATTFSGGEKQPVSIARGFAHEYPAKPLEEPTARLDAQNRETVLFLIEEAKNKGMTIVRIFQDFDAREHVCDREVDVSEFTPGIAA